MSALAQAAQALRQGRSDQTVALLDPWMDGSSSDHPELLQLMGVALMRLGRLEPAQDCLERLLVVRPRNVAAWVNLASIQAGRGQTTQALQSFTQAVELDPMQPAVHFNRGNLLMQLGQAEAACDSFRRAMALAPELPDPACNLAVALGAMSSHAEALQVLQDAVARHPGSAGGWNLLGMAWQRQGNAQHALDCYNRALECDPRLTDVYVNAAHLLAHLQRYDEAREVALRGVQSNTSHAQAVQALRALMARAGLDDGTGWLETAQKPASADQIALALLFDLDMQACDWSATERGLASLRRLAERGYWDGIYPWRMMSYSVGAAELRTLTESVCIHHHRPQHDEAPPPTWRGYIGAARPERLRIGYFSSDFHHHATSMLIAGMLEQHDRERFEMVAFCFGSYSRGDDPLRQRVRAAFDRFEQVEPLDDASIVRLARASGIHIAVDLKGHTAHSRMGLFARRMAPVQMHYLGYPGTLGMPDAIDYLLADRIVAPPALHMHYSEKIIELPDSYQANDRQRPISTRIPSRVELGLPPDAFVFCCFNDSAKITREVFALWMNLLQQRPGSVLWLLGSHVEAVRNLQAAAAECGVEPGRLVFAPHMPAPLHLARHVQADLFLDTWPCNAHTTGSDALWAGLPVLTCAGETFASRVGASLLHACGLPEMVTDCPRAYLDKALALSADHQVLQALRQRLADTRLSVPLFDTERFTRHLESAYDIAWDRFRQGLAPAYFAVPPRS
jgi:predicted O-linked N-acetylglucosamine transferase (SPINDLY family)